MPTTVEAAAIKPTVPIGTLRERMKRGSTGLLAIVELNIASPPIIQRRMNGETLDFNQTSPLATPPLMPE
jgi:hypothetical protein